MNIAPALTAIRAHLASVAAPLLRRAVSALQRAANTCESAAMSESQRLFVPLDKNRTLAIIVRGKIVEITVVHSSPNTMATLQETVTFNVP